MNMEPRKASEIIEQIQPLVRRHEKDEKLVLSEATEELAVAPGENYKSLLLRSKVTGKRGDGSPYKKSFARKLLISIPIPGMPPCEPMFLVENHVFNNILPTLKLEKLAPYLLSGSDKELVMEDLCDSGYVMCERKKMLDLEHSIAVVKTIAKLHASSMAYKLTNPEEFAQLAAPLNVMKDIPLEALQGFFQTFFLGNLQFAIKSIESIEPRTPEVEAAIALLGGLGGKVMELLLTIMNPAQSASKNWVISHGDMWINNIMFKYDEEKKVKNVKLIDFQQSAHASPGNDFVYLLYSSVRSDVLKEHSEELLKTYEDAFLNGLKECEAPAEAIKTYEKPWFLDEVKLVGMFGMLIGVGFVHAVLGHGLDPFGGEVKDMSEVDLAAKLDPKNMKMSPEKTERILFVITHYLQNYATKQ